MVKERVPAVARKSVAKCLKNLHRKHGKGRSLKEFAKNDEAAAKMSGDWFANKAANFSRPPLGIGNTGRKGSKKKAAKPAEKAVVR